jgi:hypothetical protein
MSQREGMQGFRSIVLAVLCSLLDPAIQIGERSMVHIRLGRDVDQARGTRGFLSLLQMVTLLTISIRRFPGSLCKERPSCIFTDAFQAGFPLQYQSPSPLIPLF